MLGGQTFWVVLTCLMVALGPVVRADPAPFREYEVKAAFLFNFAQYAKWPADAFRDASAPMVIGVLGKDPFGEILDRTVRNEKAQGRAIEVRRYQHVDEVQGCHILFISASEKTRLPETLTALRERPVLTVSDMEEFTSRCGMIGFVLPAKRVTLEINVATAEQAKLKIDSRLLGLANIVYCKSPEVK